MSFSLTDATLSLKNSIVVAKKKTVSNLKQSQRSRSGHEYQYGRLPPENSQIRTLILQPGTGNEPLRCSLESSSLDSASYEAISYVWGSNIKDKEILCEGRIVPITTNLWRVLKRVRSNEPRTLWADSISINQHDLDEKGSQVAMMGRIYRSAKRVLIFLGADEFGHGARVCSLLEDTKKIIEAGLQQANNSPGAFPYLSDDSPLVSDVRWKSFGCMFEQDWFRRGWVVQEAAVGPSGLVIWGQSEFDWNDVMQTHLWTMRRARTMSHHIHANVHVHRALYSHYHEEFTCLFGKDPPYSFLSVLKRAKDLDFSDPRDRIFAFAELARDFKRHIPVHANYSASFLQIYKEFALSYLRSVRDTEILDYVYHNDDSLRDNLPTWVPRWDIPGSTLAPRRDGESECLKARADNRALVLVDRHMLRVHGVIIDTISWHSDTLSGTSSDRVADVQLLLKTWTHLMHSEVSHPYHNGHLIDAFLDVLAAGRSWSGWMQWKKEGDRTASRRFVVEQGNRPGKSRSIASKSAEVWRFFAFVLSVSKGSKIILTSRGYIGLAPNVTRVGDNCAIVFGCTSPCMLRRYGPDPCYQFLGPGLLMGKQLRPTESSGICFYRLGVEESRDWVDWDVEEQDIDLC